MESINKYDQYLKIKKIKEVVELSFNMEDKLLVHLENIKKNNIQLQNILQDVMMDFKHIAKELL